MYTCHLFQFFPSYIFHAGEVYGYIQMERKDGAAAVGCIKHCIWRASNEGDIFLRYEA